jgi:hypothetical protein
LNVPGHDARQVGAVQDRDCCGQQPRCGENIAGRLIQRLVRRGPDVFEPANIPVGRSGEAGIHEVPAKGPGRVQQRDDEPDVRERAKDFIGGLRAIKHAEQTLLGIQHALTGMRFSRPFGRVQANPASGVRLASRTPRDAVPALRRVQRAVPGRFDELPAASSDQVEMILRAPLMEESLVARASEGDRQEPVRLPGPAVLRLDRAAITG